MAELASGRGTVTRGAATKRPHGHVPGVTNADGTPWFPIKQQIRRHGFTGNLAPVEFERRYAQSGS